MMKFVYAILATLLILTALRLTGIPAPDRLIADTVGMEYRGDSEASPTAADDTRTSSFPTSSFQLPDRSHMACALGTNNQHRAFFDFLTNWQESQQRFVQHQQEWLKAHMEKHQSYQRRQADCLLSLSPRPHPFGSGKPCKSYYVFAMRHIVI